MSHSAADFDEKAKASEKLAKSHSAIRPSFPRSFSRASRMKKTSKTSILPTSSPATKGVAFREARPRTPDQKREEGFSARLKRWVIRFTSPSTGTPSDGLDRIEGSESSASVTRFLATQRAHEYNVDDDGDWHTDETVVKGDPEGLAAAAWRANNQTATGTQTATETNGGISSNGSIRQRSVRSMGMTKRGSNEAVGTFGSAWHWLRWRLWPNCYEFFYPSFEQAEKEEIFQRELWYNSKKVTAMFSLYLVLNWILYLAQNSNDTIYKKAMYYGGFTFVTLPLPILIFRDLPRKMPPLFQLWFGIAVFYCGWSETIGLHICSFYRATGTADASACGGKDFLAMLMYALVLPAIGLFTALHRFVFVVGAAIEAILIAILILPDQREFVRNFVNYVILALFLVWLHKDMLVRQQYILNSSLKHAYRNAQKSQMAESHANASKRRLTSYVFHEVRVPLNVAMLAFQNLQAESAFKEDRLDSHATEIHALESSLAMMQQVLSDILDLQRLDTGRFEANYAPFPLHRAINSLLGAVRVATTAKRLEFVADLDPRIDALVARLPEYREKGLKDLYVHFDELRLRQVLSNLASNAVKFTQEGRIMVRTRLLSPLPDKEGEPPSDQPPDAIVWRFEVHDNGPGLRPNEIASMRLFTPFRQTTAGRLGSTKGSGLGLAIIRSIVSQSGGRLGVISSKGKGACFWCEFGLRIATVDEIENERDTTMAPLPSPPELRQNNQLVSEVLAAATHSTTLRPPSDLQSRLSDGGLSVLSSNIPSAQQTPDTIDSSRPLLASHNTAPAASVAHRLSPPPPTRNSPPPNEGGPLRVLCVDDDPMTRTLMSRMLTRLGCQVEDGQQFLDTVLGTGGAGPRYFDAVTLDNQMPVLSGQQAIRMFRDAGRTDLVVGCTGNALREDQANYLEAGASRVLTKPVMQKDLKIMLAEAEQRRKVSSPPSPTAETFPPPALSPIPGSPRSPTPP